VRELNQSGLSESPPHCFRHDWTPEELEQREKLLKPLTLEDLKRQVDEEYERWCGRLAVPKTALSGELQSWTIGDFIISRRL
jgi:hypothetical protein